jgi:pimeloyl-ACP methyl ester carboxylesterase
MQVENGDVTLDVETTGDESAPPLLLMHGITVSRHTWDWFVPSLAERYRVIAFDFRGHGKSGRAPGDYQPQAYVTDAIAVLETLTDGPVLVIGHSLGGRTAAALAQQRPDLVRGALLEDPPLGAMDGDSALHANPMLDAFRLMRASVPGLQAAGVAVDQIAQTMATMPSSSGVPMGQLIDPGAITVMAAALLDLDATVLDPILDGSSKNSFDPMQPIDVPTLIVSADPAMPDALATPAVVDPVIAISPQVEHRAIPGAGHLVHDGLASRDGFVEQVEDFLARF